MHWTSYTVRQNPWKIITGLFRRGNDVKVLKSKGFLEIDKDYLDELYTTIDGLKAKISLLETKLETCNAAFTRIRTVLHAAKMEGGTIKQQ